MGGEAPGEITVLLRAWSRGDKTALERLVPLVEQTLRRIARYYLKKERPDPLLDTADLMDEAYVQLMDLRQADWKDRVQFYSVCAGIIRHILVDHARARSAAKRGGGAPAIPLEGVAPAAPDRTVDLLAIHEALEGLAKVDPRKGRIVELRFFGGLNVEETAHLLGVSSQTVERDWHLAKLWLHRELKRQAGDGPGRRTVNQTAS